VLKIAEAIFLLDVMQPKLIKWGQSIITEGIMKNLLLLGVMQKKVI